MNREYLPRGGRVPLAAPLSKFADAVESASRLLVWLSGAALIAMALLITTEALLRKFAGVSLGSIDEVVMYVFAASATCSFGFALIRRAHIRIEIIRGLLPAPLRAALDILAWLSFFAVFLVLAIYAVDLALGSYMAGARSVTVLRVPMVWPQGFWALGLVFTVLAALGVAARAYSTQSLRPLTPANEIELELEQEDQAP